MSLEEVRKKIDSIDQQLLRLLNERAELVHAVGEIKRKDDLDIYVPGREDQLLRKLAELNRAQNGRLTERAIRAIFREIMSAALALEDSLKIAYLGPAGSWTHQAAVNKFGHCVEYLPEASTESVFGRVASQDADYGVLPIEHSTEGAVHHTLDHLADSALQIYAEILWKADVAVMAQSPTAAISEIHGRAQMLARCGPWLAQSFPGSKLVEAASSNAAAALAAQSASIAALGTPLSAELHGLRVIAASPREYATQTRLIILGRRSGPPSGNDNTMLMIHSRDRVGALMEVLQVFATRNINVRQIENRPTPCGTQARFFLEISGHHADATIRQAVAALEEHAVHVKTLGSYPAPGWVEER
ncbi:MAG: chorismate mutase [Prosthecobacter sp.]|uniref:chorismate mutase n=1 Tax=Prosthecobacter sp. TaxID=1965333 RepID=UPI0019E73B87|nr:chorismate mutase [Prosthecobacter sp.]MBE2286081.1 chorismate mutase [Prosthecobacter sp.]